MKITGIKIMELLRVAKGIREYGFIKDFVGYFFDPLKTAGASDIFDCCSSLKDHRSEILKGRYCISRNDLKLWAEEIKNDHSIYEELIKKIKYYYSNEEDLRNSLINLFNKNKDSYEIPKKLSIKIEEKFNSHQDCEAILLMFLFAIYGTEIPLLSFLYDSTYTDRLHLLTRIIPANPIYIGHESFISSIHDKLQQGSHYVFLQGMGGIGKTETSKQYVKRFSDEYDTVVFAEFNSSIMALFNDNTVFTLTQPFDSEFRSQETAEDYYKRKLAAFRQVVNQRTLIILDNVDVEDQMLSDFLTGLCHVIVTTRLDTTKMYSDSETISLEVMPDIEECKKIFSAYYGKDISNDPFVVEIIKHFSGHILALELTAKQMRASELSAEEMWKLLSDHAEDELEEGILIPNNSRQPKSMAQHIQQIFNIAHLSEKQQYILSCMAMLPKKGLARKHVRDFCGLKSFNELDSLVSRSWLRNIDGTITIHSLIQESVQLTSEPTIEKNILFIENMSNEFQFTPINEETYFDELTHKYEIISHLYNCYPNPNKLTEVFYECAARIFAAYDANKFKELSIKLYEYYYNQLGETHFKTLIWEHQLCKFALPQNTYYSLKSLREKLKTLQENNDILLLLEDVDTELVGLITYLFDLEKEQYKMELLLNESEELCAEFLKIHNQDTPCLAEMCMYMAQLAIRKHQLSKAEKYIILAEKSDFTIVAEDNLAIFELMIARNEYKDIHGLVEVPLVDEYNDFEHIDTLSNETLASAMRISLEIELKKKIQDEGLKYEEERDYYIKNGLDPSTYTQNRYFIEYRRRLTKYKAWHK